MIRKLTLGIGFGAGYVLGARAGKERYRQIEAKVRELMGRPAVQDFTNSVSSSAAAAAEKAKATVNEKVEAVSDKVSGAATATPPPVRSPMVTDADVAVVDLGSTDALGRAGTGGKPGSSTGPVPGAASSRTS